MSTSCLISHKNIKVVLNIELNIADASSIQYWIEMGIKKLGFLNYSSI
ncbi:MAG: hypothetical protein JXA99_02215 [Candidatus Lokiarchaeota archaeon]|nr:hypothetical protein [Candidatus Lokiarchaeota archaeon]